MWNEQEQQDADGFMDNLAGWFFDGLKILAVLALAYAIFSCTH